MKSLAAELVDLLRSAPGVARVTRSVFRDTAADRPRPHVTLFRLGTEYGESHRGATGLDVETVQVSIWADDDVDRDRLAAAVRARLRTFRGVLGCYRIDHVRIVADLDQLEAARDGRNKPRYGAIQDYEVRHAAPVPA